MFSCKYCESFKTPIYFEDYLRTAASESKAEFPLFLQNYSNISKKSRDNIGGITEVKYTTTVTTKSTKSTYTTTFFTRTQHLPKSTTI